MENRQKTKPTKTHAFLLPASGVDVGLMYRFGFGNAYINDSHMFFGEGRKLIYLLFNIEGLDPSDFEGVCAAMRKQDNYVTEYDPEENKVMIVMEILEKWNEVYDKFVIGKYSEIPKEYTNKYFRRKKYAGIDSITGEPKWIDSFNWQVLNKSIKLRVELENRLDVKLPEGAEVYSRPNEKECYR